MKDTINMISKFEDTGNYYLIDYCKRLGMETKVSREWYKKVGGREGAIKAFTNSVFVKVIINKELGE